LTGIDILTGGTLANNISFLLVPSIDVGSGTVGFESANVRLDNLWGSPWLNFKFGKFEQDVSLSEKRMMTLSNVGGAYQLYHFVPRVATRRSLRMGRSKTYLFLDYRWGADTRCWSWQSIVLSGRCLRKCIYWKVRRHRRISARRRQRISGQRDFRKPICHQPAHSTSSRCSGTAMEYGHN